MTKVIQTDFHQLMKTMLLEDINLTRHLNLQIPYSKKNSSNNTNNIKSIIKWQALLLKTIN